MALPFAILLFLACLSEIEALLCSIKDIAQSTILEKKLEGQALLSLRLSPLGRNHT
jgi:hypothetical protein